MADTGRWLFAIFDDASIDVADVATGSLEFTPLANWDPPGPGQVFVAPPGFVLHTSGQFLHLDRPTPDVDRLDIDSAVVAAARLGHNVVTVCASGQVHTNPVEFAVAQYRPDQTVLDLPDVVDVAAALGAVVLLDGSGTVWTAGARPDRLSGAPVQVPLPAPAHSIDTNGVVEAAVDDSGRLWLWGVGAEQRPRQFTCDRWLREVRLSTERVFAVDIDGHVWDAPTTMGGFARERRGPVVASGGLWTAATTQWAVDVDGHVWLHGTVPTTPTPVSTTRWWRLGVPGTERFSLTTTMFSGVTHLDELAPMFAAVDRLAR